MFKQLKKFVKKQAATLKKKALNVVVDTAHKTLDKIDNERAENAAVELLLKRFDVDISVTNGEDFRVSGHYQGIAFDRTETGKSSLVMHVKLVKALNR